jgi:Uncharacterised nucleotidyltransferase
VSASRPREHVFLIGRHAVRCQQLGVVVPRFNAAGIVPLVLKGMALVGDIYAPHERPAADIDILVRAEQFEAATAIVRDLGYRDVPHPGREATRERLYHLDFDPPPGSHGSVLEVHRHVVQPERYHIDLEGIWTRSTAVERHGGTVRLPAREDHILVLAIHRARHDGGFLPDDLRNVDDIDRLLRSGGIDWQGLTARAGQWRCRRALFLSLDSLSTVVPEAVLRALAPGRLRWALIRTFLERRAGVWVRKPPRPGGVAASFRKLSMVLLSVDSPVLVAVSAGLWSYRRALDLRRRSASSTERS